jgi:hypothetical protein
MENWKLDCLVLYNVQITSNSEQSAFNVQRFTVSPTIISQMLHRQFDGGADDGWTNDFKYDSWQWQVCYSNRLNTTAYLPKPTVFAV